MLAAEWRTTIKTLATSIRDLRHAVGWSQQALANRAIVSQGAVSRLEAGTKLNLPFHTVVVAARALAEEAPHLGLSLSPPAQALVAFAPFDGTLATSLDPDLRALLRLFHGLPPRQRHALVVFLESTASYLADTTLEAL
jgi:transcriptional regulator with XRE-family HTH domain